jgi:mannose-6-phosphate isomerase-like protein (cupin superfamily)
MLNFERVDMVNGSFAWHAAGRETLGSGQFRFSNLIGPRLGARHMTQFYACQSPPGGAPLLSGDHDVVLFMLGDGAEVDIGGKRFDAPRGTGVYVRPGEHFRVLPSPDAAVDFLITYCPGDGALQTSNFMESGLDEEFPERTVHADHRPREASGDRYYKLLVGPETGSKQVTQFIGMIPRSRAKEHFHTYEEAICVLSGNGLLHTGSRSTPIGPGSVIFLPVRQPHCIECLNDSGMELVGLFHPAGSPAVNYKTGETGT